MHGLRRAVNKSAQLHYMGAMDSGAGNDAASAVRHRCRKFGPESSFMQTWAKKPSFRRTEPAPTQRVNRVPVHHRDAQQLPDAHDPTRPRLEPKRLRTLAPTCARKVVWRRRPKRCKCGFVGSPTWSRMQLMVRHVS